jgi:hypothetical protein
VASITKRRAELAGLLWELSKIALGVRCTGGVRGLSGMVNAWSRLVPSYQVRHRSVSSQRWNPFRASSAATSIPDSVRVASM